MSDSIIQEVRAIREQHAASMDYDLDRIFADLKVRQEKHVAEGWILHSAYPSSYSLANYNPYISEIQFYLYKQYVIIKTMS